MLRSVRRLVHLRLPTHISITSKQTTPTEVRNFATRGEHKVSEMKRKDAPSKEKSPAKKTKTVVPEYHAIPSIKEEDGSIQWPAPKNQMEKAREIILEWHVFPVYTRNSRQANIILARKRIRRHWSSQTKTPTVSHQEPFYDIHSSFSASRKIWSMFTF